MEPSNILAYVKAHLAQVRISDLDKVAASSGVPVSTIRKVRYGEVSNPRIQTVQALYDHFQEKDGAEPANV